MKTLRHTEYSQSMRHILFALKGKEIVWCGHFYIFDGVPFMPEEFPSSRTEAYELVISELRKI